MPSPSGFNYGCGVFVFWLPAKLFEGLAGVGNQSGRVPCPAWSNFGRDRVASHFATGVDDLTHAVAVAGSKVDFKAAAKLQSLKSSQMSVAQIVDVGIISHAGSVGRWPIVTVDRNIFSLAQSYF